MAMGFGCNAVGVTGCRIIDSPRERLIAILTNSLVPCNGRFPTLITLSLFFMGCFQASKSGIFSIPPSLATALLLTGLILLGIGATLLSSLILSKRCFAECPPPYPGASAIPQASAQQNYRALCAGPHPVRSGPRAPCSGSGRPDHMAVSQYPVERRKPPGPPVRLLRSSGGCLVWMESS